MRVLVIKLGALGDVVMATALIDAIARAHPAAALWLLTTPAFAPLFEAWPRLAVTAIPRRGWRAGLAALRFVRAQRFDRVYDLQGNDRSGILCALSGSPMRIGNHCRFPYTHHPPEPWRGQCHIFERMNAVLASAGVAPAAPRPVLPATEDERAGVAAWLAGHGLGTGSFAALHAGASGLRQEKCWPHYGELAARIEGAGLRVVWVGAAPDAARNASLAARCGIDATGAFSIPGLARLAGHARFAVTNDSGPMHVMAAAGIPIYGLFGPSDWRRNHALGQAANVIACVEHVPAFRGARVGDCLAALEAGVVWERLVADGMTG